MKTQIMISAAVLILTLAGVLTSCKEASDITSSPDPVQVLEDQLISERELRKEAELKAEDEAEIKDRWKLWAMGLGALVVVGFIAGTAIGSTGRRHAESP